MGLLLLAVISLLNTSCVEEYWPEIELKYEKMLVVDGMITNQPGPYEVRLSNSTSVEWPLYQPLSGYTVIIADDTGQEELLTEKEDGVYSTAPDGIRGVVGRSYRILIYSEDGETYESAYQELRETVGIGSVYARIETRNDPAYEYDLAGYQFYVDTELPPEDSSFFLWKMEATYKFNSNHTIRESFDRFRYRKIPQWDTLYTCWKIFDIAKVFTHSTIGYSNQAIEAFPLNFVSTETRELSIRYSLLVSQLVIDEEAYDYWYSIQKQNDDQGALHSRQPYQIRGNIFNPENEAEQVMGYFLVAAEDSRRIFVDRPTTVDFHYLESCSLITEDIFTMLLLYRTQWPLYLTTTMVDGFQIRALPTSQTCVDCTDRGGVLEPPDYWTE